MTIMLVFAPVLLRPPCAQREFDFTLWLLNCVRPSGLEEKMQGGNDAINWRTLIAACAAVCVFAFSLGEIFPLLSLNMESWGTSAHVIGLNSAMAPVGILLAGL